MAKKKVTNEATLKNTVSAIQEKASSLNNEVLTATEELVEGSVNNVKQWQGLLAKLLNNGTELLERQQNFSIDVLENVVNQTKNGGNRAKELVNFDFDFKNVWSKNKDKISIKNLTTNFKKTADEVVEKGTKAVAKAKKVADEMVEKGSKTTTKAKKTAGKTAKKATKKTTKAVAKAKKTVKASTKK